MKVLYERPVRTESGLYLFKSPLNRSEYDNPRFTSIQEAVKFQEQLLQATDGFVNFFEKYQLPTGIESETSVRFRLFRARGRDGFRYWKTFGEIGFPDFSVQTDLGSSKMYMWPKSGYLELELSGVGLTEKAVAELLPTLEAVFKPERQVRVENYRELHQPSWALSGRVLIPANI